MTLFTPADRDATLQALLAHMEADARLEAAVVTGSLGAGTADRWSDIDVTALVVDHESAAAVADDWISRMYAELPTVHHYRTSFESTIVPGFLLGNGLEVDLAFAPGAEFSVWAPVRVAFDRSGRATAAAAAATGWSPTPDLIGESGFAWHDVVHACVAIRRSRPWRALFYLQRVRNRTLRLASERHGWDADDFDKVDDLPAEERDPLRMSLVADLGVETLRQAVEAATEAFLAEVARGDPALAERLAPPLRAYLQG